MSKIPHLGNRAVGSTYMIKIDVYQLVIYI